MDPFWLQEDTTEIGRWRFYVGAKWHYFQIEQVKAKTDSGC
jgi:hypothetical protein